MSCMRYMLTLQLPFVCNERRFKYSMKLKTKFCDYDGFIEEIKQMIDSGELRRMVEKMTEHNGGQEKMTLAWLEHLSEFDSLPSMKAETEMKFLYFKNTEGGMDVLRVTSAGEELSDLYHWKKYNEDYALLDWMKTARIGEHFAHRLGHIVRVLNEESK